MELLYLIGAMLVVGLLMGWVAGLIWKDERPLGVRGDYLVAVISAISIGLLDWFVIPAMGFSDTMKFIGIALEPALGALFLLWIIRRAKR